MSLGRCRRCDGLSPRSAAVCLHCGATRGNGRALFFAASAAATTLVACACYGAPVTPRDCDAQPELCADISADDAGVDAGVDAGTDGGTP